MRFRMQTIPLKSTRTPSRQGLIPLPTVPPIPPFPEARKRESGSRIPWHRMHLAGSGRSGRVKRCAFRDTGQARESVTIPFDRMIPES